MNRTLTEDELSSLIKHAVPPRVLKLSWHLTEMGSGAHLLEVPENDWAVDIIKDMRVPVPDGYALVVHRAAGSSSCYFGPFATMDEVQAFVRESLPHTSASLVPLYLNVD